MVKLNYHLILICLLIVYLCLGAYMFMSLERKPEQTRWKNVVEIYQNISKDVCISFEDLHRLLELNIDKRQIEYLKTNNTEFAMWDYYGSLFFSLVVISTVGYGNQVPVTTQGQLACVVYALFGIPIFMSFLQRWSSDVRNMFAVVKRGLPEKFKKHHNAILAAFVVLLFVTIFMLPAMLIGSREDWEYHTSFYFAFVTLTTIGFGDYVPTYHVNEGKQYKIFILIWMFIGLAYVALLVTWLQVLIQRGFDHLSKRKLIRPKL